MGSTNSGKASWPAVGPFSGQVWLHGFDMPNFCPQQYPRRALRITVHEFLSLTACKKRWNSGLQEEHETLRFFSGNKHHYCCGRLCYLKRIKKQHRSAGFSGLFSPPWRHHQHFKTILWKHGRHCSVLLSIGQNRKSYPRLCRRTYFWKERESDGWTEKTKFSYLVFALRYPYRIKIIS